MLKTRATSNGASRLIARAQMMRKRSSVGRAVPAMTKMEEAMRIFRVKELRTEMMVHP